MLALTLFSAVMAIIIINSFIDAPLIFALPVLLCVYITVRFCYYCSVGNSKRRFTPVLVVIISLLVFLINWPGYYLSFTTWMYIVISDVMGFTAYYVAIFIFSCFFIPAFTFYFAKIRFRPVFLLFVVFIAFLFNDQRYTEVRPIFMALTAAVYYALIACFAPKTGENRTDNRLIQRFAFALFILAFPITLIEYSQNRSPLTMSTLNIGGLSGLLGYSQFSSNSDSPYLNERILFTMDTDEPLYLMRQVFDTYGETRRWQASPPNLQVNVSDWEIYEQARNLDDLIILLREVFSEEALEELGIPKDIDRIERFKMVDVQPQGVRTEYVPAPIRTFQVSLPRNYNHIKNANSEILVMPARLGEAYTFVYYIETLAREFEDSEFFRALDFYDFKNMIEMLILHYESMYYHIPETVYGYAYEIDKAAFFGGYDEKESLRRLFSDRLHDLAYEITGDYTTDYDKAAALVDYFRSEGYVYSLEYPNENNTDIDQFIFNNKTGLCRHYATAMTVMAQMSGLKARYVEGFYSTERDRYGRIVVRAKHAHAWTQVYIAPYGWVTFEPTVPSLNGDGGGGFIAMLGNYTRVIFSVFSIIIIVGGAAYLYYRRFLEERMFISKASKSEAHKGIVMLYRRIHKKYGVKSCPALTLRDEIMRKYGEDISDITELYNKILYGTPEARKAVTETDLQKAIETYIAVKGAL